MTTSIPEWDARLPWLRAGTTQRGFGSREGVAGGGSAGAHPSGRQESHGPAADPGAKAARALLEHGWRSVVRSRQVHGSATRVHADLPAGASVVGDGDGHVTRRAGLLLAVTLADCVPVFVADPVRGAVGLLHAGWRGTAAGVVERGIGVMGRECGSVAPDLFVHLGPAICGRCYEVGPDVFAALCETPPPGPAPIDLRAAIRRRARSLGVRDERLSVSRECTLCGDGRYYSHRGGDLGRHLGFIGILPESGPPS